MRINVILLAILLMVPACGIVSDKFNMDTGLDGCVEYTMDNFSAGPVRADKVMYHRINDKCKDVQYHSQVGGE